jgi:4'-phosphopantetheinyl transferase EntD
VPVGLSSLPNPCEYRDEVWFYQMFLTLVPSSFAVIESAIGAAQAPLFPEESVSLAGAIEKRRREFIAGRTCARKALGDLGCPEVSIPIGSDRAPIWPAGYVGSITHEDQMVAAVVGHKAEFLSVGIDLETRGRVTAELYSVLFVSSEQMWLQTFPPSLRELWATALYCAKEAFYKFQYPVTKTFLEFTDVMVGLDLEALTFEVTVLMKNVPQLESVRG